MKLDETRRFDGLRRKLPVLVFWFFVLQPVLDMIGYWQSSLKLGNAFTLALRILLLAALAVPAFLLTERKRAYLLAALGFALFTGLHVLACTLAPGGYSEPARDLVNLVRIYMLPITALCFLTFFRRNPDVFPAVRKGMCAVLLLILAAQLLSTLTRTDPHTYRGEGVGVLGWFLWTNSQSAILSMLLPIVLCCALQDRKNAVIPVLLATAAAELPLFLLAPRLAYVCMLAVGFGYGLWVLVFARDRWKQALAILLVTALFLAAYPISPTKARKNAAQDQSAASQQHIDQKELPSGKIPGEGESLSEEDLEKYEKIYHSLGTVYSVVERFGLERTLKAYNYTLDASVLCDARLRKITYCRLLMEDAGPMSRLFGLNLSEMFQFIPQGFLNEETGVWEDGYESLDVENDFHGVYFLTGAAGLLFFLALFAAVLVKILLNLRGLRKSGCALDLGAFSAAFACAMLHAVFTASVLRRNNASVYLAVVVAAIVFLCEQKKHQAHLPD